MLCFTSLAVIAIFHNMNLRPFRLLLYFKQQTRFITNLLSGENNSRQISQRATNEKASSRMLKRLKNSNRRSL
jgi:hypothetical protein